MGTKRSLAPIVASVISRARPGVVLDAFSGMCAIGQSVGTSRNIWSNDVQLFASTVAAALFTSPKALRLTAAAKNVLASEYRKNHQTLTSRFARRLNTEQSAYRSGRLAVIQEYLDSAIHVGRSQELDNERQQLAADKDRTPYRLCAITFADGYFSLRQAIEIDSARFALDSARQTGNIGDETYRWLLIAMCSAAGRIATTTGHFAQYLTPNSNNLSSYTRQRRRFFVDAWREAAQDLRPLGTARWRNRNRTFNRESLTLLGFLCGERTRPSVVYADPPYTDDQYSRYYHVWETLLKYDYPRAVGVGRYRPDRFHTPFSRMSEVGWAFSELIRRSAQLGADLVLSYPSEGLLHRAGFDLLTLLRQHYPSAKLATAIPHSHSTMGASKGRVTRKVMECIYLASNK
jgi:adenine-specific DNA-methyltransferase